MFAHAGGAATLDVPTWLLADGAAVAVLVAVAGLRARLVPGPAGDPGGPVDPRPAHDPRPANGRRPDPDPETGSGTARPAPAATGWPARGWRAAGRTLDLGAFVLVVAVALAGPEASAANLAPPLVLTVWWVGLSLAAIGGDVMAWLDPFGTTARWLRGVAGPQGGGACGPGARNAVASAPLFLAAFRW